MLTSIVKRDGREVPFNLEKITDAIFKAARAVGGQDYDESHELAIKVVEELESIGNKDKATVEEVQDAVEKVLIENGHAKTAKSYILYRAERSRIRDKNNRLMKVFEDLTFKSSEEVDLKRENANIDGDTAMGTMLKYGSESAKEFYDLFVLNPAHSEAHGKGKIHIHDLDFLTLTMTCCQIDLLDLFEGGFGTGHGFLREPNSIRAYSALACIAIQANQNDQHGGQSVPNFDYAMADGVRKSYATAYKNNLKKAYSILGDKSDEDIDNIIKTLKEEELTPRMGETTEYDAREKELLLELEESEELVDRLQSFARDNAYSDTDRETYQAMEALIHNLNTMHSRAGAQIPFSSINYGTDTSLEGQMVIKNLLLSTESGLGNGETAIFPIQIFKVKEGINYNPGEPNYDLFKLACRVSSKRLFPNFSFIDAPFNLQYYEEGRPETEIAYMGCRTRVISNQYDKEREIVSGRGNLSFTTINLPKIALENREDIDGFYKELDETIDLVIEQLLERFEVQANKKVSNFPFLMGEGVWIDSEKLGPNDTIRDIIKHGTLSIGFIGLAEALVGLTGEHHGESEEAQKLGLEIIGHMRDRMDEQSEKTGLNFSLIATPAEGTAGRFVKMDRETYGEIEGITNREYYTNSFHVPVYYDLKAIDKINKEAPYHALTNAGHITYVEVDGDPSDNIEAFETLVRAMKEAGIGYGSINHPVDRDPVCGYTGIIGETCPSCGREEGDIKFDRIRRITGYLVGTLDRFNDAKAAEERDRVKHAKFDR